MIEDEKISLSSLKKRKDKLLKELTLLDDAIKALESLDNLRSHSQYDSYSTNKTSYIIKSNPVFNQSYEEFAALSILDAAVKILFELGPLRTADIIKEMEYRGKKISGKNPFPNVYTVLSKASKRQDAKVRKISEGLWAATY